MRVLFLDVDGVLNSTRSALAFGGYPMHLVHGKFDIIAIRLIQALCAAAKLNVVMSSAWRNCFLLDDITTFFELPIIDKTGVHHTNDPTEYGCERGREIKAWLDAHSQVEEYAIVDDDDDMLPEQQSRFVQTSGHEGLSYDNFRQLCSLFGLATSDVLPSRIRVAEHHHLVWGD